MRKKTCSSSRNRRDGVAATGMISPSEIHHSLYDGSTCNHRHSVSGWGQFLKFNLAHIQYAYRRCERLFEEMRGGKATDP